MLCALRCCFLLTIGVKSRYLDCQSNTCQVSYWSLTSLINKASLSTEPPLTTDCCVKMLKPAVLVVLINNYAMVKVTKIRFCPSFWCLMYILPRYLNVTWFHVSHCFHKQGYRCSWQHVLFFNIYLLFYLLSMSRLLISTARSVCPLSGNAIEEIYSYKGSCWSDNRFVSTVMVGME